MKGISDFLAAQDSEFEKDEDCDCAGAPPVLTLLPLPSHSSHLEWTIHGVGMAR